jgi:hypothetical protein
MFSKVFLFSFVMVLGLSAQARFEVCGPIAENDDGDMTVTSQTDGLIYIIGENENMDDTPEVSEAGDQPVCFEGELEDLPDRSPASTEVVTLILNVENVWIPVTEDSGYTGGGGGRKGVASFPCPDFL